MLPDNHESPDILGLPLLYRSNYDPALLEVFSRADLGSLSENIGRLLITKDAPLYWNCLEFHSNSYEKSEILGLLEQTPSDCKLRIVTENKKHGGKRTDITYGYSIQAFFWQEIDSSAHLKLLKRYEEVQRELKERQAQAKETGQQFEVARLRREASKLGYKMVKKPART